MISYRNGFLRIFHSQSQVLHLLVSEEIGFATCRNHEFVVSENAIIANHLVFRRDDFLNLRHSELNIFGSLKDFSERERDVGRFDSPSCHLVEQGLEHMMVHLIDDHYFIFALIIKISGELQTCKSTSDNNNFFPHYEFFTKLRFIFSRLKKCKNCA